MSFSLATPTIKAPPEQPRVIHDLRGTDRVPNVHPGDLVITESGIHIVAESGRLWAWEVPA